MPIKLWRHQMKTFSALMIHWLPVDSPNKGQQLGAVMFSLMCARTNGWANSRDAGDLGRHGAHYDVIVMELHMH